MLQVEQSLGTVERILSVLRHGDFVDRYTTRLTLRAVVHSRAAHAFALVDIAIRRLDNAAFEAALRVTAAEAGGRFLVLDAHNMLDAASAIMLSVGVGVAGFMAVQQWRQVLDCPLVTRCAQLHSSGSAYASAGCREPLLAGQAGR